MAMFFSSLKLKLSSFGQPGTSRAQPWTGMYVYNCQIKTSTSEPNSNYKIHVHTEIVVAEGWQGCGNHSSVDKNRIVPDQTPSDHELDQGLEHVVDHGLHHGSHQKSHHGSHHKSHHGSDHRLQESQIVF